ncbi:MAG: hypothetical protein J6X53_04965, partial [Abditibacteriota bacterium]|nr:hypothetical protein [Abditibacteriota bacterium]
TTDPIAGAQFLLTDSSGKKLGTENGVFTTDSNGRFTLSGLKPGLTVKIQQTTTADGFLIDSDAKTIAIESGDTQTVTVYNAPKQSLTVQLYVKDSTTTIVGGRFLVTDGTGAKLGSEDGVFTTDENGRFSLRGLVPGTTVKLKQTATADGYLIDGEAKTITVKSGEAQTVTVYNAPTQALTVKLYVTGTTTPIEGAKFLVRDSGGKVIGESNGMYTTDHNGEFTIHGLTPGVSIRATQTDTISDYVLSGGTQSILIKSGAAQSMTFYNPVSGSLTIQSLDSLTNAPISGTEFKVLYADGRPVDNTNGQESSGGQYFTDTNGEIHITGIVGTVVVTEEKAASGYTMDANNRRQTVIVSPAETQTLTFKDTPDQALTIQLYAEGTTEPIANAQFLLTDGNDAKLGDDNGTFTTDASGRFTLTGLKTGVTVKVKQLSTADDYLIDGEGKTILIKSGNAQTVTVYNALMQTLNVQLYVEGTTDPIAGAKFLLNDSTGKKLGSENGVFTTDANGRFTLAGLKPGVTVKIVQTSTADGYLIDGDTHAIAVESG